MNGAEALLRTLVGSDVTVCFTNPGTSEMHFVAAVDRVPEMRTVLGLFEGVVTGAADGYARMAGGPAATLLHLGPGLGNGVANLHNARRARSPVVNVVGDHATGHRRLDAPLQSDIETIARNVSAWVRTTTTVGAVATDAAEAVAAAVGPPGQVATLILPADVSWTEGATPAPPVARTGPATVADDVVAGVAKVLASGEPTVLLVGGAAVGLALIFGTALAFHYNGSRSRFREVLQLVIFLPFLMPPIITGLSLLIFFRETDIPRSLVTVVIGHTVFVMTLAYRTIVVRLQTLGPSLIEASYDLGASTMQTFFYVVLPSLRSALIGSAVLCFALSFDETLITILVTGTDNTLPIRLWAMMRLGFTPDINALVALILGLTTLMCTLAVRQLLPKEMTVEDLT